jgi:hypothetical protein
MKQTDQAMDRGMNRPAPVGAGNSGTKTEDLKDITAATEDPKLLNTIESRLKNLGEITRESSRSNPAVEEEDNEDEAAEEKPADEPVDSDSPTLDGEKGLPEAYVRSAIAYGWKENEVVEFFNADPERALTTLSNIYNTRNKASSEFAALGRRVKEDKLREEQPKFVPVDVVKLRGQYGEEAAPLIEVIEAQNKQLAERIPKPAVNKPFESAAEQSNVEQQIHGYFESDRMKPWEKVYGKLEFGQTWDDLPAGAREHRQRLLTVADQIAGGARLQGVDIRLDEVLEAAHLLVTQKYRDQVLLDGVKGKIVARSKGITVKPSSGTRKLGVDDEATPGNRTREQLVTGVAAKLGKLFPGG